MGLKYFDINNFGFCRDCLVQQKSTTQRCVSCGSPRIVNHPELNSLSLAHIDCDAFYASVEKRDNSSLQNKPVIIGGGKRGVVSTACYIARIHGVRSAMPMFKALQMCPEAIVIPPNMEKYREVGQQIRQLMLSLTPLVEPLSIDEAFLDLSGTEKLHKAPSAYILAQFSKKVFDEIGITVSVGLSYCKFLAKIASDLNKPRGFSIIGRSEAISFLAAQPVHKIWGVGRSLTEKLAADGITNIAQLQQIEDTSLMKRYGIMGRRLYFLSRGIDDRKVESENETKSISSETTFTNNLSERHALIAVLRQLSENVSLRLKKQKIAGYKICLKLKTSDFKTKSRSRQLPDSTQMADRIFRVGLELLEKEIDGTSFRLLGVGVQNLVADSQADPVDLIDRDATKRAAAENAIDQLREKFGGNAVETGYTFNNSVKTIKQTE